MKKLLLLLSALLIMASLTGNASAFFIDFEDGSDGIMGVNDIEDVSFQIYNGSLPLYGDSRTNKYSTTSDDLGYGNGIFHHNGNLWLWAGMAADATGVKVDFDNNDGTWFQTGYSSTSAFYIDAFLTDGSKVTVKGNANTSQPMDFLRVDASAGLFIDYVVLHDSGNQWLVDDMSGDTSIGATVPEPATMLLFGIGIIGLAGINRRKQ